MEINLVFEVKGKKVSLTDDEARELYNQLKELYGDNGDVVYVPIYPATPFWENPPYVITCGVR